MRLLPEAWRSWYVVTFGALFFVGAKLAEVVLWPVVGGLVERLTHH